MYYSCIHVELQYPSNTSPKSSLIFYFFSISPPYPHFHTEWTSSKPPAKRHHLPCLLQIFKNIYCLSLGCWNCLPWTNKHYSSHEELNCWHFSYGPLQYSHGNWKKRHTFPNFWAFHFLHFYSHPHTTNKLQIVYQKKVSD